VVLSDEARIRFDDLDANLVSRNILIPLLLSELRPYLYILLFQVLRKILGVCYLSLIIFVGPGIRDDTAVNICYFTARGIPCSSLLWRVSCLSIYGWCDSRSGEIYAIYHSAIYSICICRQCLDMTFLCSSINIPIYVLQRYVIPSELTG
jgi:hypothetical protein